jgi:Ca2+-binding RTX toxin-like protein
MTSVSYSELTIEQGSGDYSSHVLISITSTGEYLAMIENASISDITAAVFASTSTADQTFSGTSDNDTFVGGAGSDTFTTGAGTDVIYGHGGDDTITINSTGAKTVNGGAGTDTLIISYSGITSLGDFVISSDGDYTVLTDANGGVIKYKSIENLTVGDYAYSEISAGQNKRVFWSSSESTAYLQDGTPTDDSYAGGWIHLSGRYVENPGIYWPSSAEDYSGDCIPYRPLI